jgi:hypothetical protein
MRLGVLLDEEKSAEAMCLLTYCEINSFHELVVMAIDTMMDVIDMEIENG